ncbi:MAG: hypothetical protein CMO97_02775 [Woeseia sp.]|nr:hypothetical protein [Woeseia sp.]|tara:strand:+ start:1041 stop:1262 length:222 start_codon:yes stop_codon:yes gene_type:complete
MNVLLEALCTKLEGDIAVAKANVEVYTKNAVGIGEHPDIIGAIDIEIAKAVDAEDKLKFLHDHFGHGYKERGK